MAKVNTEAKNEEMVTIRLIRDENHRQPLFVGLNGKGYLVQRGVNVQVPKAVAEIINNSLDQQQAALDYMDSKKYVE